MKKSFLRILSITVTLLLIVGMVMMPASAAVPETGTITSANYNGGGTNTTMYRASDAAEAGTVTTTNDDGTTTTTYTSAWLSSDSSVWKFAVGTLGDTFKASSADFAAPTAVPVQGGGIKISWTAPAEGSATVKVVADSYSKEVVTTAKAITLYDADFGKTYQVQVTVGDVSSEILAYNHIYAPTYTTNSWKDKKTQISSKQGRAYDYMFVNLEDYVDEIDANSGILVKVSQEITDNSYNIISYEDKATSSTIKWDDEGSVWTAPMPLSEATLAFHTRLLIPTLNTEVNGYGSGSSITANANATRMAFSFDPDAGKVRSGTGVYATHADRLKYQDFDGGYIFIPFDMMDEASMAAIKEVGAINLNVERQRYYAKNYLESNGTYSPNIVTWGETDYGVTNELTGEANYWLGRNVYFESVEFIADYDAFLAACYDSENLAAGVQYDKLTTSSATKDTVYLNTVGDTTTSSAGVITAATLSNASVASTYTVGTLENISYTTAAGEKMKLGFTASVAGVYDVACPITVADYADKGVYTRVIKEATDGTKTIIQAETAYNGERHLALLTEELAVGDTVWFEAWANSAATVIDLGMPQMTNLAKYTSESATKTYSWYTYFAGIDKTSTTLDVDPVMSYGYFINNFEVDGTEYDYIYAPTYDAATTVKHDMLGLASLAATNDETTEIDETDATELYNALTKHEKGRGNILKSKYDCYRYRNEGTSFGIETNATNGWQSSGIGTTGTRQMRVSYGFTTAFGGSLKNVYYDAGVYMQFTAPSDGVIDLTAGNGDAIIGKGIVLHNSKVIAASTNVFSDLNVKTVAVEKGDTITVCYGTTDGTNTFTTNSNGAEVRYDDVYDPRITFNPDEVETATVTYDQAIDSIIPDAYDVDTVITLPAVAKNGAIFQGWNDGTTTYKAGTAYTVKSDVAFTAEYIYYGNLDGDVEEKVTATDLTIMRQMLLKYTDIEGKSDVADITADIDANGDINLIDLVKMKKMSVGIETVLGAR